MCESSNPMQLANQEAWQMPKPNSHFQRLGSMSSARGSINLTQCGDFHMRKKATTRQSDPMLKVWGRPVVYNRDIFIEICGRMIDSEDIHTICTLPGMPVPSV